MGGVFVRGEHDGGAAGGCVAEWAECYRFLKMGEVSHLPVFPVISRDCVLGNVNLSSVGL